MKPILTRILLFSALLSASLSANAGSLSPSQALARALETGPARLAAQSPPRDYKLQYARDNAIYLFAAPDGGYLAVSGDDDAPAILAYSDGGEVESSDIPPAMRAWLDDMAEQIAAISRGTAPRGQSPARDAIAPMITTKWNQDDPYNRKCPLTRDSKRCLTGCTATAMAQIMNYHEWPAHGEGQISYKTSSDGYQVDADFSAMTFDWANMADTYTSDSPEAECNAVAQLMFAAGAASEADYRSSLTGASIENAARALYTYFGYDKGLRILPGGYYTVGRWEDAMYDGLRDYGPVLCCGDTHLLNQVDQGNAHAYVCDGYSDGYFHINWGWSGRYDGYFLLSALNPYEDRHGYSYRQTIVTGITKPKEGSVIYSAIINAADLTVRSGEGLDNEGHNAQFSGRFENNTRYTVYNGKFGVRLTAADGTEYIAMDDKERSIAFFSSSGSIKVTIGSSIPDGRYTVVPVYQLGTEILDIMTSPQYVGKVRLDKSGSELIFSDIREHTFVRAENVTIDSPLYIDCLFRVSATLKNTGDMRASVRAVPVLFDSDNRYVGGGDPYYSISRELEPEESVQATFTGGLQRKNYNLKAGQYTLYFVNAYHVESTPIRDDDFLSEGIPVTVKDKPVQTTTTVTGFKVNDEDNVNPDNVSLSWRFTCDKGYYTGKLKAVVYAATGGYPLTEVSTDYIFLEQGNAQDMTLSFPLPGAASSTRYWVALLDMNVNDWTTEQYYFTTAGSTGLPALSTEHAPRVFPTVTDGIVNIAGDGISAVSVYSIAGTLQLHTEGSPSTIDLSHLPSGIYLVRLEGDNPAVFKIIKK